MARRSYLQQKVAFAGWIHATVSLLLTNVKRFSPSWAALFTRWRREILNGLRGEN